MKAAPDVYLPVSGKVIAINEDLPHPPESVNSDPYGSAWKVKVELNDLAELADLLDAAAYKSHLAD